MFMEELLEKVLKMSVWESVWNFWRTSIEYSKRCSQRYLWENFWRPVWMFFVRDLKKKFGFLLIHVGTLNSLLRLVESKFIGVSADSPNSFELFLKVFVLFFFFSKVYSFSYRVKFDMESKNALNYCFTFLFSSEKHAS